MAVRCGYDKGLPFDKVPRLPGYLEPCGDLQNTEVLTFPILRETKRQAVRRIQYPSVPGVCGEENQPAEANNTAIVGLRFLNDVIGLPVYADLLTS